MRTLTQSKEQRDTFLKALMAEWEVIAPVKTDASRFEPIKDPSKIYYEKQTYEPAKKYFFPQKETLFQFDGTKLTTVQPKSMKRIFFGLRRCDLNAIQHQDMVFIQDAHDPYYAKLREQSVLIGYHCNTAPSEYCFCGSLKLEDFFDLMYYDKGDHLLVEIGSEKGEELVRTHARLFEESTRRITQEDKFIPGADRLKRTDVTTLYDRPEWKEGVDLCLSCGACTSLCPTCYCFEIHDETSTADLSKGTREREWSSCQLPGFSRVAGDHVFRKEREQRFKHRIYHQLQYFQEKYGKDLCVGCGRCITGCPTRIDFVDIINRMPQ
ncbi:MAG: 4Fe-4S dicluster domain-containing protein [Candidatus Woesearchaeota archaeon]